MLKVSIITVCYNSEKTIARTIESVLAQTVVKNKNNDILLEDNQKKVTLEYIIVDGASTDRTLNIVKNYKNDFDNTANLKLIVSSEPDQGIYDAMNKGIHMASGEIIGIINSDDFYEKNAVEKVVEAYLDVCKSQGEKKITAVFYGMCRHLVNGIEESIVCNTPDFLEQRPMAHPSCFITKSAYELCGVYDLQYPYVADYDLLLRMYKEKQISFKKIEAILANFSSGGACGTQAAYFDLLKFKVNNGLMKNSEAVKLRFKAKVSSGLSKILMKK